MHPLNAITLALLRGIATTGNARESYYISGNNITIIQFQKQVLSFVDWFCFYYFFVLSFRHSNTLKPLKKFSIRACLCITLIKFSSGQGTATMNVKL